MVGLIDSDQVPSSGFKATGLRHDDPLLLHLFRKPNSGLY